MAPGNTSTEHRLSQARIKAGPPPRGPTSAPDPPPPKALSSGGPPPTLPPGGGGGNPMRTGSYSPEAQTHFLNVLDRVFLLDPAQGRVTQMINRRAKSSSLMGAPNPTQAEMALVLREARKLVQVGDQVWVSHTRVVQIGSFRICPRHHHQGDAGTPLVPSSLPFRVVDPGGNWVY